MGRGDENIALVRKLGGTVGDGAPISHNAAILCAEVERLAAERDMLRLALVTTGVNLGARLDDGVSSEFLALVADEARALSEDRAWQIKQNVRMFKLIQEADEYLNTNKLTNIAHGSILHQKLAEAVRA